MIKVEKSTSEVLSTTGLCADVIQRLICFYGQDSMLVGLVIEEHGPTGWGRNERIGAGGGGGMGITERISGF